jgi:hypothetical protein
MQPLVMALMPGPVGGELQAAGMQAGSLSEG